MTVATNLAAKLSRARIRVRDASARRDELIRQAVEAGGSYREVARLAGVSHQTVANITKKETPCPRT